MRPTPLSASIVLTLLAAGVFAWRPGIDMASAAIFYRAGSGFPASHSSILIALRQIAYWTPAALLCGAVLGWGLRKISGLPTGPSTRNLIFMAATFALGPGLLANVVLKDHSHRPRPLQVVQFGGQDAFRPWYRFDGACMRNCSFVSGEASAAFWTVAPALAVPPQARLAAVVAAITLGTGVSALRMAFGGHFLSDVALAAGTTLVLVLLWARLAGLSPETKADCGSAVTDGRRGSGLRERQPTL